ncbi:TPA: glycosyltransferase family 4 protein [Yersinia enterocolitica]
MIKVLHFYKTFYPDSYGGVEQVIYQLAKAGTKYSINSTILSVSKRKVVNPEIFEACISFKAKESFSIASTPFSFEAINHFKKLAENADVIHYHFPYPYMDMVHFFSKIDKPSVVSYHSDILKQKTLLKIYKPLMFRFLEDVNVIVATSSNYCKTSEVLLRFKNKVRIIPIGLNKESYPVVDESRFEYWRQRFKTPFYLFIGALRYYKGLHILLNAMVRSRYPLVIVGAGSIEADLKKQAHKLGLDNVFFLGLQSDVDKVILLKLCFCVIFPSHLRTEAFGITLLEGAMFGKPLISSEIGTGTTYINIHQETGVVVPPSDPIKLREAMDFLWDNPNIAERYGIEAEKRFKEIFTADLMALEYSKIYRSLLE